MTRRRVNQRSGWSAGRSVKTGALLGLLGAVVVGVVAWQLQTSGHLDRSTPPDRVAIALACVGEDEVTVTPVVAVLELGTARPALVPVDPLATTTIPGTTYDRVWDAYAFGGGAATASAISRADLAPQAPAHEVGGHVVVPQAAFQAAIERSGGLTIDAPSAVSVFTGKRLYTFPEGIIRLSAGEVCEYLKGLPYLADSDRSEVNRQFADAIAVVLSRDGVDEVEIETDLSTEALAEVRRALGSTLGDGW
ncbi:MAG: hypothetical protein IBX63_04370 [Coriobacteriia bacterium]|nr:hypothetical protein [Coriobacteriia bacterium]